MARRGLRWRLRRGPLVLLYHRVAPPSERDAGLSGLSVTPEHFAAHLALLRRRFEPLPLRALLAARPRLRRPAVAVTFDDGYADNLAEALPLLERFGIPATFFVTSGMLGGEREFWWDALERWVARVGGGIRREHAIDDAAYYWRLHARLLALDPQARAHRLAEMSDGSPPRHRTLTHDELRALADHPLCEVGAHTRTHPRLSELSRDGQRDEIEGGRTQLEELLGREVTLFAYPFGEEGTFDDRSVAIAREAGFEAAFTGERGAVPLRVDRFRVPRCSVPDWDGEKLGRRLARWSRR